MSAKLPAQAISRDHVERALEAAYVAGNGGTQAWKEALYEDLASGVNQRVRNSNELRMRSRQAVYDMSRLARDLEEGLEDGWPPEVLEAARQMQTIAEPILGQYSV